MKQKFEKGELRGKVPYGKDCVYTFANGETLTTNHALSPSELAAKGAVLSKRIVDNPEEQTTLRLMAEWRRAGWSLKRVAAELNARGIASKLGGQWQSGNVDRVLRSAHTKQLLDCEPPAAE
jgi:hypothetical protein